MLRLFRGPKIKRIAQGNPLKFFTRGNSANDSEKYRPASLGANAERRVYLCLTVIYYQTFRRLSNDFTELFEKRERIFADRAQKADLAPHARSAFCFSVKKLFWNRSLLLRARRNPLSASRRYPPLRGEIGRAHD